VRLIFKSRRGLKTRGLAAAAQSDTVFYASSASVPKTAQSGQWRHPDIPVVPFPSEAL